LPLEIIAERLIAVVWLHSTAAHLGMHSAPTTATLTTLWLALGLRHLCEYICSEFIN
jgi:hypothetical protein